MSSGHDAGPVMAHRFLAGTKFSFGSLDFTATSAGVLRPTLPDFLPPTTPPRMLFSVSNFAATAARALQAGNPVDDCPIASPPPRHPGHHGRSKRNRPRLPRELRSRWVEFLVTRRSDSDSESSNNTPTSSRRPQEIFITFQETDEERRSAASNLNRRLNELRQRGCAAQDAILQTKLGERDVFTMPQNNKIAAKALLDNIQVPNDPAINTTIAQVRAMVEAATFQHAEVALTASIVGGSSSNRPSQQQHAGSKHIEASQAGSSRPSLRTSDLRDKIEARRRSPQRHE